MATANIKFKIRWQGMRSLKSKIKQVDKLIEEIKQIELKATLERVKK